MTVTSARPLGGFEGSSHVTNKFPNGRTYRITLVDDGVDPCYWIERRFLFFWWFRLRGNIVQGEIQYSYSGDGNLMFSYETKEDALKDLHTHYAALARIEGAKRAVRRRFRVWP